jgi:hypothetical protein
LPTGKPDFSTKNSVTVTNVAELEFLPSDTPQVYPAPRQYHITVNGVEREEAVPEDGRPIGGQVLPRDASSIGKTDLVEGPVSHAFAEPFLVVAPSQGISRGVEGRGEHSATGSANVAGGLFMSHAVESSISMSLPRMSRR